MFKLILVAFAVVVCCVNADDSHESHESHESLAERHGGRIPGVQILGGGSRRPPNSFGQPGFPLPGTGHLPIENNGQWQGNYHGGHDSYGNHGGHGGHGGQGSYGNYGHQGNYGNHGSHGHGNYGNGHGHGRQ